MTARTKTSFFYLSYCKRTSNWPTSESDVKSVIEYVESTLSVDNALVNVFNEVSSIKQSRRPHMSHKAKCARTMSDFQKK